MPLHGLYKAEKEIDVARKKFAFTPRYQPKIPLSLG